MKNRCKNKAAGIFVFIDRFHWLWLALSSPLLMFPSPKRSLFLLVVPSLWLIHYLVVSCFDTEKSKSMISFTPLNISLLLMIMMVLVSLWATSDMVLSLEKVSGTVLGFGVFFCVVRSGRNRFDWLFTVTAFLTGGFAWAVIGFLGMDYRTRFALLTPIIRRIPRLLNDLPGTEDGLHHNAVGGTLLWVVPLFLIFCLNFIFHFEEDIGGKNFFYPFGDGKQKRKKRNSKRNMREDHFLRKGLSRIFINMGSFKEAWTWLFKILCWTGAIFSCVVLLLSQSRGSYLALGLTLISFLLIVFSPKWRRIFIIVILIIICIFTAVLFATGGWERFVFQLGLSEQTGFSIDSIAGRIEIWRRAVYGIQDFPITGMGMNTFREVVHILYPLFTISPDLDFGHAHNEFLQTALDLGIPGLIAFISIYIISFWMLYKIWQYEDEKISEDQSVQAGIFRTLTFQQMLVLGLGGGLFGHMVFGMADAITLGAKPGIFYWYLLGLITSLYKLMSKDHGKKLEQNTL